MRQIRLVVCAAFVAALAAPAAASPGPVNPDPGVRTYRCQDGQIIEAGYPTRDTAVVKVGGRPHPMRAQVAASGVRYVGYGLQWWTKGLNEGRLSRLKPGETIASDPGVLCRVQADAGPAAAPGQASRGAGASPVASASAEGAAQVVESYYALLGQRRYADAWRLWSPGAPDRARSPADFAAQSDRFASLRAQVGTPGAMQGAAGSLYVETPVRIYGLTKDGREVNASGKVTLRRANDVPGSTAAQRRWSIYRIDLNG